MQYVRKLLLLSMLVTRSSPAVATDEKPEWIETSINNTAEYHYYIGSSDWHDNEHEAKMNAWMRALLDAAALEFPSLLKITRETRETLDGASFDLRSKVLGDATDFPGLDRDPARPDYVEKRETNGKAEYRAYRVARWKVQDIEEERKNLKRRLAEPRPEQTNVYQTLLGDPALPKGTLRVTTEPAGAQIILAGKSIGVSNAEIRNIAIGSYRMDIQVNGYEPVTRTISLYQGDQNHEKVELVRKIGILYVTSNPEGATIYLDNIPKGRTPIEIKGYFGEHEIKLEKDGYHNIASSVSFTERRAEKSFNLARKTGRVTVLSTPSGADVSIDGRYIGKTPLSETVIEGGERVISVSSDGFETHAEAIQVNSSNTLVLNLSLKEGEAAPIEVIQQKHVTDENTGPGFLASISDSLSGKPYIGLLYGYTGQIIESRVLDKGNDAGGVVLGLKAFSRLNLEGRATMIEVKSPYANGTLTIERFAYSWLLSAAVLAWERAKIFLTYGGGVNHFMFEFGPSKDQKAYLGDNAPKDYSDVSVYGQIFELGLSFSNIRITGGGFLPFEDLVRGYRVNSAWFGTLSWNTSL